MPFDWTNAKEIAAVFAAIVAACTFLKGLLEYTKQGRLKRVEYFLEFNRRFVENDKFREIRLFMETNDPELEHMPVHYRREYAGFLEEAAILTKSGLIRPDISMYFFGYFALDCWDSEYFWFGLEKNQAYWNILRDYVEFARKRDKEVRNWKISYRL